MYNIDGIIDKIRRHYAWDGNNDIDAEFIDIFEGPCAGDVYAFDWVCYLARYDWVG